MGTKSHIGIFGGSFNPPHLGHIRLATEILEAIPEFTGLWLVPAVQNPLKDTYSVEFDHRFEMTRLSVKSLKAPLFVSRAEEILSTRYTSNLLRVLSSSMPGNKFSLIIGSDCVPRFHEWRESDYILGHYDVFVYDRGDGVNIPEPFISLRGLPLFDVSSTAIRESIEVAQRWMAPEAYQYALDHNLYGWNRPPDSP